MAALGPRAIPPGARSPSEQTAPPCPVHSLQSDLSVRSALELLIYCYCNSQETENQNNNSSERLLGGHVSLPKWRLSPGSRAGWAGWRDHVEQRQALVVRGGPQGVRAEGTRLRLWTPVSPSRQEGARAPKPATAP